MISENRLELSKIKGLLVAAPDVRAEITEASLLKATPLLQSDSWDAVLVDLPRDDEACVATVQILKQHANGMPVVAIGNGHAAARQLGIDDELIDAELGQDLLVRAVRRSIERKRVRRAFEAGEQRYRLLLELLHDAILVHTDSECVIANGAALKLLGADRPEQVVGKPVTAFVSTPDGEAATVQVSADEPRDPAARLEKRTLVRLDGGRFDALVASAPCTVDGKPSTQLVVHDLAAQPGRHVERVQYDVLTDLPSRTQFRDRLIGAMARARRAGQLTAVLFIDLDDFAGVNTAFGQVSGDEVLKRVAERLGQSTRETDTVGRLSGDEFALTLEGLVDKEGVSVVADRLLATLAEPIEVNGPCIVVTASIGIAVYPDDASELDALWRNADVAMFHAKDSGRNNFKFYSTELVARSRRDELRRKEVEERFARLTRREREVMELLATGKANKMVAYLLGTSTRTIETHRAKIMDKMEAESLADLVRMALELRAARRSDTSQ